MVYIISLHRAAGSILPGHGNYVNRHILSPDFFHALRVRLSVKKFSHGAVYIYIYTLIIYINIHNNLLYIHIHTHPHPRQRPHPLPILWLLPLPFFCLALPSIPLPFPFRSACLLPVAGILSNPPILSAFQSHAKPRYFLPCVFFCFLLQLAVSLAWGCGKVFEMLARSFLKVYGFVFVCRKFYVNEKFYVNKYLPKAKVYIDV